MGTLREFAAPHPPGEIPLTVDDLLPYQTAALEAQRPPPAVPEAQRPVPPPAPKRAPRRSWTLGLAVAVAAGIVTGLATVVVVEMLRAGAPAPAVTTATPDAITIGSAEVTSNPPAPPAPAAKPATTRPAVSQVFVRAAPQSSAAPVRETSTKKPPRRVRRPPADTATKTLDFNTDDLAPTAKAPIATSTDLDAPLPH
jgi:hypothetical protein